MNFLNKSISLALFSGFLLATVGCTGNNGKVTETETTVLEVDTVDAEVTYDVNRKTVESVDTVGATTEYEVEKKVVKRTIEIDTITKELSPEEQQDYAKGDYEVVEEEVEKEQESEEIEIDS
jgi:hypothetical protein